MANVRKTMDLVKSTVGQIPSRYDLCANNMNDIYNASNDAFDYITNAFRFGFAQGMKAAKAETIKVVA